MEVNKKSTDDKIIYATIKLLDLYGLSGTTTRKIAEEAGVSEVTIFRKFKTKKNLFKVAKKFYYDAFFKKLDEILKYEGGDLREYLISIWKQVVILSDDELNMIKIALEELRDVPIKDKGMPQFSEIVISKLSDVFQRQIDEGKIREINTNVAALNIFCLIFDSIILWKVYGVNPHFGDVDSYLNDFLDIFLNGISIKD